MPVLFMNCAAYFEVRLSRKTNIINCALKRKSDICLRCTDISGIIYHNSDFVWSCYRTFWAGLSTLVFPFTFVTCIILSFTLKKV